MKKIKENEPFQLGNEIFAYQIVLGRYSITKVKGKVVKPDFIPPTLNEVKAFFKLKGYTEQIAITFFDYYENGTPTWTNKDKKQVKSWKQTAISIWFRDEHKIKLKDNTIHMIR